MSIDVASPSSSPTVLSIRLGNHGDEVRAERRKISVEVQMDVPSAAVPCSRAPQGRVEEESNERKGRRVREKGRT